MRKVMIHMGIIVHVGSLDNDATRIYRDKLALEALASHTIYTAKKEGLRLYKGKTKPFLRQRVDSTLHFGIPIQESYSGLYFSPIYEHGKPNELKGYLTFIKNADGKLEEHMILECHNDDKESIATSNANRLFELLNKAFDATYSMDEIFRALFTVYGSEISDLNATCRGEKVDLNVPDAEIEQMKSRLVNRDSTILITLPNRPSAKFLFTISPDNRIYEIYTFFMVGGVFRPVKILISRIEKYITNFKNVKAALMTTTRASYLGASDASYLPLVLNVKREHDVTTEMAVEYILASFDRNPFLTLEYLDYFTYESKTEYNDILLECFMHAMESTDSNFDLLYEAIVHEDLESKTREIGAKINDGIDKVKRKVHAAKTAVSNVTSPIVNLITKTIDDYKKDMDESDREHMITGSYLAKLRSLFTRCLAPTVLVAAVAGSALAIPAFLMFCYKKNSDDAKTKAVILNELELELKMVKEKIEDARSAGDNEKKYQLMRIENSIEKNIQHIRLERTKENT